MQIVGKTTEVEVDKTLKAYASFGRHRERGQIGALFLPLVPLFPLRFADGPFCAFLKKRMRGEGLLAGGAADAVCVPDGGIDLVVGQDGAAVGDRAADIANLGS